MAKTQSYEPDLQAFRQLHKELSEHVYPRSTSVVEPPRGGGRDNAPSAKQQAAAGAIERAERDLTQIVVGMRQVLKSIERDALVYEHQHYTDKTGHCQICGVRLNQAPN